MKKTPTKKPIKKTVTAKATKKSPPSKKATPKKVAPKRSASPIRKKPSVPSKAAVKPSKLTDSAKSKFDMESFLFAYEDMKEEIVDSIGDIVESTLTGPRMVTAKAKASNAQTNSLKSIDTQLYTISGDLEYLKIKVDDISKAQKPKKNTKKDRENIDDLSDSILAALVKISKKKVIRTRLGETVNDTLGTASRGFPLPKGFERGGKWKGKRPYKPESFSHWVGYNLNMNHWKGDFVGENDYGWDEDDKYHPDSLSNWIGWKTRQALDKKKRKKVKARETEAAPDPVTAPSAADVIKKSKERAKRFNFDTNEGWKKAAGTATAASGGSWKETLAEAYLTYELLKKTGAKALSSAATMLKGIGSASAFVGRNVASPVLDVMKSTQSIGGLSSATGFKAILGDIALPAFVAETLGRGSLIRPTPEESARSQKIAKDAIKNFRFPWQHSKKPYDDLQAPRAGALKNFHARPKIRPPKNFVGGEYTDLRVTENKPPRDYVGMEYTDLRKKNVHRHTTEKLVAPPPILDAKVELKTLKKIRKIPNTRKMQKLIYLLGELSKVQDKIKRTYANSMIPEMAESLAAPMRAEEARLIEEIMQLRGSGVTNKDGDDLRGGSGNDGMKGSAGQDRLLRDSPHLSSTGSLLPDMVGPERFDQRFGGFNKNYGTYMPGGGAGGIGFERSGGWRGGSGGGGGSGGVIDSGPTTLASGAIDASNMSAQQIQAFKEFGITENMKPQGGYYSPKSEFSGQMPETAMAPGTFQHANANAQKVMNTLMRKGLTREQAEDLTANFMQESGQGLNTSAVGDRAQGLNSFGIGQWNRGRFAALKKFAEKQGKPITDIEMQAEFALHEMETTHKNAGDAFKAAKTTAERYKILREQYEVGIYNTPAFNAAKKLLKNGSYIDGTKVENMPAPKANYSQAMPSGGGDSGKNSPLDTWNRDDVGKVTSQYAETRRGMKRGFGAHRKGTRLHAGVDYFSKAGEAVKATEEGTVIHAKMGHRGYGGVVDVLHKDKDGNEYVVRYGHINVGDVKVGQKIKAGDNVGTLDGDEHLHLEVRDKKAYDKNPFQTFQLGMSKADAEKAGLYDPVDYFNGKGRFAGKEKAIAKESVPSKPDMTNVPLKNRTLGAADNIDPVQQQKSEMQKVKDIPVDPPKTPMHPPEVKGDSAPRATTPPATAPKPNVGMEGVPPSYRKAIQKAKNQEKTVEPATNTQGITSPFFA